MLIRILTKGRKRNELESRIRKNKEESNRRDQLRRERELKGTQITIFLNFPIVYSHRSRKHTTRR